MRAPLNYIRSENDFYSTPAWVTEYLLYRLFFSRDISVWDPFAGNGALLDAVKDFDPRFNVFGSDINPQREEIVTSDIYQTDMKGLKAKLVPFHIITNPPYGRKLSGLISHLKKIIAIEQNPHNAKLALLLNLQFISTRAGQLVCRDMEDLLLLPRRIRWIEGSKGSPRESHAWYIWSVEGIRYSLGLKRASINFAH